MAIDPRFLGADSREVFTGNEALVKGCLEAEGGVHLLTGYPGSPVAGFFDAMGDIKDLLSANGVRAFQANNEALAAAAVNGSQMLPCRAVVAMKNVGLHVAADALALANLAGTHPQGGAIVISGEDPWCDSTQVPADSRFLCEHLRMPVIEPGTLQELKDWIDLAFKVSQASRLYMGYIVTPAQADGGGTVQCRPNQFPGLNTRQKVTLETKAIDLNRVLLPPRTWQREVDLPERFALAMEAARRVGINRIFPTTEGQGPAPVGFIVCGMGGVYLEHVLAEAGLAGRFPVLRMGMTYPVDVELVRQLGGMCRSMIVVEERRSFLEKGLRDGLFRALPHEEAADLAGRLYGKTFPGNREGIPDTRGLNYSVLAQRLLPLLESLDGTGGRIAEELGQLREASRPKLAVLSEKLVARTATFCPGCPHRDSAAMLLELRQNLADAKYMQRRHGKGPVDLVAHGDTGCYTMLMFAPTEQLMHNYSGMGLGGGTGSGIDPFITNKQIVFMGDSTFFHSGQVAITNSIKAGQEITYIILENGTTAMTGHQDHAGIEEDMFGNRHPAQSIEQILRGMAKSAPLRVERARPEERTSYRRLMEETILSPGVKVIIADKECGITHRRSVLKQEREIVKERGFLPRKTHMNVTPEVCEGCLECTKQTGCPGLMPVETDYGRKIDTDLTWCVNDGACERVTVSTPAGDGVKPCPSFEEVTVIHRARRRYLLPDLSLDKLPEPEPAHHPMDVAGSVWRCHMSGVGGMGIGLVSALLVRAGHKEGYRVLLQEKKGLAIRNGGVFSQITFVRDGDGAERDAAEAARKTSASIPYGRADLLLGVDILEAARAVDSREVFRVASPQRTAAVLNLHKQATVSVLLGRQDFEPETLRQEIYSKCRQEQCYAKNIAEICEQRLGSKQFANIMMLGVAYQLGLIPVSAHAIAWAIRDTIKREHRRNLKAFNIGRKLALEPRVLPLKPQPVTWEQLIVNKTRILKRTRFVGQRVASAYEALVRGAMEQMPGLDERVKYDLALRLYDLMQYQDLELARTYLGAVRGVYGRDSHERRYAATAAAIWNLAKVMLIKDEPYVAYLLTRYEKKQRDLAKYGLDPANGDRIVYRHHTNPELVIGPWRLRFRITTRDWMLHAVRHCKWLRRLPGWHAREGSFRDWYAGLLDRIDLSTAAEYDRWLEVLRSPEAVSGYREVRYPKMDAARAAAEARLARAGTAPAEPAMAMAGSR